MPRFVIEGASIDTTEVESDNWMSALGEALDQLGFGGERMGGIECDVLGDGDIAVTTSAGPFTIREVVETIARIRVGPDTRISAVAAPSLGVGDDLGVSPLDAPDPTTSPSWRARAESAEIIVHEIDVRALALSQMASPDVACAAAIDLLMEYVPAESGAVLLVQPVLRDLRFVAARGPRSRGLQGKVVPSGRGIAGLVVRSGVAMTVREAQKDPRHYGDVDRGTGYHTHAILSVPIRTPGEVLGCIELLNPFAGTEFSPWHQSATLIVASKLAAGLRRG